MERAKSSARSKSPFRSFRFKKKEKEKETGSGHYSDDEENYDRTIESGDGELEGMLVGKHNQESLKQVLGEDLCCAEGEPDILLQRPEDVPHPPRGHLQGRTLRRPHQLHCGSGHRLHKEEICLQAETCKRWLLLVPSS